MKNLYIIIGSTTETFFSIASFLAGQSGRLARSGWQYQGVYHPVWQYPTLVEISTLLNRLGNTSKNGCHWPLKKAKELFSSLARSADISADLVWLTGPLRVNALPWLHRLLEECGFAHTRLIHTLTLAPYIGNTLLQIGKRAWKQRSWSELQAAIHYDDSFSHYDMFYTTLAKTFTAGSNAIIYDNFSGFSSTNQEQFIQNFTKILSLPVSTDLLVPVSFPYSFAALDMAAAVYSFPFSFGDRIRFSRDNFYKILCKVETEEGYKYFRHLPVELLSFLNMYNSKIDDIVSLPGMKMIASASTELLELEQMPETIPELNVKQCEKFVAAIDDNLRTALLRWFRDRGDQLQPRELLVAHTIENYHKKCFSHSIPNWPRRVPTVTVLTMCHNHAKYITDCLESVASQKVDFPIEHVIVDDASCDGSQDIIDNYARAHTHVRPVYIQERSYAGENVRALFSMCKSEFAALCDGDDYFTHPAKLQRQVDFLRANKDFSLVFHPVNVCFEAYPDKNFVFPMADMLPKTGRSYFTLQELIGTNFIQTNSVVYRWRFHQGLPAWFMCDLCPGDWYWHLLHAEVGKIGYIADIMAVYRRHPESLYNQAFKPRSIEHRKKHGMMELKTFKAIDDHFKNRFFNTISILANGVLNDFVQVEIEEDNTALMDEAGRKFPNFCLNYLKQLPLM